jgi:hypothetical protein
MFSYPLTVQFHADAAPQAVWAALEAVSRWPEVIPDLAAIRIEPEGPLAAGAVIHTRTGPVGATVEMEYRVIEAEPPRHLLLETETYDWLGRTDYTIEADGDGAQVTVVSTMNVTGMLLRLQMLVVGKTLNEQRATALRARTHALLTLAERMAGTI